MIQFGEIGIEVKSGVLFSAAAFVFSVIAGFAGGVSAINVLIRSLIFIPVFFAVGFGAVTVIKNFVPELYEHISEIKKTRSVSEPDIDIPFETSERAVDVDEVSEKADSGFSEFTEKDYERLQTVRNSDKTQTVNDSGIDSILDTSGGKLGKHIIVENQLNTYEPKLMAQAIRTMMSKDKE